MLTGCSGRFPGRRLLLRQLDRNLAIYGRLFGAASRLFGGGQYDRGAGRLCQGPDDLYLRADISRLVRRGCVSDVWIGGERIIDDRALTTADESAILARARIWQERLK